MIEPVTVGANAIFGYPGFVPKVRSQFVFVERQPRPAFRADDDPPMSRKRVPEFHHTIGSDPSEIDDDEPSPVQSLEDLDVHEGPLRVLPPHFTRGESVGDSYYIHYVSKEAFDPGVRRVVGGQQPNVERRRWT